MRVVLINDSLDSAADLSRGLVDAGHQVVANVSAHGDLFEVVERHDPDLLVLHMDRPNSQILNRLYEINQQNPRPVVIFADQDDAEIISEAVKAGVSAYVVDGLNAKRLNPIINVAVARFKEYQGLRRDLDQARAQLEERKLIERAKGLLMQRRGVSEDEAYKSLRKLAMDRNKRLADVAAGIVEAAELLG